MNTNQGTYDKQCSVDLPVILLWLVQSCSQLAHDPTMLPMILLQKHICQFPWPPKKTGWWGCKSQGAPPCAKNIQKSVESVRSKTYVYETQVSTFWIMEHFVWKGVSSRIDAPCGQSQHTGASLIPLFLFTASVFSNKWATFENVKWHQRWGKELKTEAITKKFYFLWHLARLFLLLLEGEQWVCGWVQWWKEWMGTSI